MPAAPLSSALTWKLRSGRESDQAGHNPADRTMPSISDEESGEYCAVDKSQNPGCARISGPAGRKA
jgi:hypothetical protein